MRIAIDARIINTSTGRYVERLLHHLQEIDHDNEYTVLLQAKDMPKWRPVAANFKKLEADFPIYSPAEQAGFAKLLNGLDVDLVHFTMPQHPVAYLKPYVVTVHDVTLLDYVNKRSGHLIRQIYSNYIKPAAFRLVMRKAVIRAKAVITPSKFVRDELVRRYKLPVEKMHLTYEAADPLVAEPMKPELGQGENFLLYVGNAYPYKNLKLLVEAFRQLGLPGLKLVLVGKKDYFYEQLEQESRAVEGVIFAGFVPDDQLRWLYENAKLYVFPSLSEGFGLPPLEAMQYGLPVLSSNAGPLPEVYGPAAQYFDPHSSENLAKNIEVLLKDGKRWEALSVAGQKRVKQFSWRKMAEQTLDIYLKAKRK